MTRPRVFVSRRLPGDAVERLRVAADVDQWEDDLPPPRTTLIEHLREADGAVTLLTERIDADLSPPARASRSLPIWRSAMTTLTWPLAPPPAFWRRTRPAC